MPWFLTLFVFWGVGSGEESDRWRHFSHCACADKYSKTHHLTVIADRRCNVVTMTSQHSTASTAPYTSII